MHVLLFLVRQMHPCSACKLCRTDKLFHVCVHVLILKGKLEVVRFSETAGARFSCAPLPSLTLLLFTHSLTLASSGGLNRKHPLGLNVFGREAAAPPPSCEAPLCLCAPSGLSAGRAGGRSVGRAAEAKSAARRGLRFVLILSIIYGLVLKAKTQDVLRSLCVE